MNPVQVLGSYWRARRLRFDTRESLLAHQERALSAHLQWLARHSAWFAPYAGQPLATWPMMDKALMMREFDRMNTAGLQLSHVLEVAHRSEMERDFVPLLDGYTVGLSSGTSATRGVFVVSPAERATWAGVMLAKALPRGLLARERVALLLRAGSSLYTAVRTPWISFEFFDLFEPFEKLIAELVQYQPTIVVAPAQVLRALALRQLEGDLGWTPARVISVAEVLEPGVRALLEQVFGEVHELYQATEGFLASTCRFGTLHLNEAFLVVEPEWLDERKERFVPVITDFTRKTQPIVRYRLNDVLVRRKERCPCGSHAMALAAIEGREGDLLELPGTGAPVRVFADVLHRAFAQALPLTADYELVQTGHNRLRMAAQVAASELPALRDHLVQVLGGLGARTESLEWSFETMTGEPDLTAKRRRIRKELSA